MAVSIFFLWKKGEKFETISIFDNLEAPNGKGVSNNIVDELLLSANEFKIYGKSSLIEYNYKGNNRNSELLYQEILNNKLQKINQSKSSTFDFNVKPVPK